MEPAQGRQDEIKRLRDEHQAEARHRVKLALILEAIAQKEGIRVEEEDLQNEYRRLADGIRVSVDEVRRMVAAGGEDAVEEFRGRLLAEKTLDFVYRQAMIQG